MSRLLAGLAVSLIVVGCGRAEPAKTVKPVEPAKAVEPVESLPLPGQWERSWGPPGPGDAAPDFELSKLDGAAWRLSSVRGAWVFLHFTASWCPFCDAEVTHLGRVADRYADRGLKVVLVDIQEPEARWRDYAGAHVSPSVIALHDAKGTVAAQYAPPNLQPSFENRAEAVLAATFIVDPQGTIRLFVSPDSKEFDPTFSDILTVLEPWIGAGAQQQRVAAGGGSQTATPDDEPAVSVEAVAVGPVVPGGRGELAVSVHVSGGYHVMSNPPSKSNFIATELTLVTSDDVEAGAPRYPKAVPLQLSDEWIDTYLGRFVVYVPVSVSAEAAPGERALHGKLHYQACTETHCLFPRDVSFDARLTIASSGASTH